jgi:hypothetical protein
MNTTFSLNKILFADTLVTGLIVFTNVAQSESANSAPGFRNQGTQIAWWSDRGWYGPRYNRPMYLSSKKLLLSL